GKTSGPCALEHQLVHEGSQLWPDRLHFAAESVRTGRADTAEGLDIGMHAPTAPVPQTAYVALVLVAQKLCVLAEHGGGLLVIERVAGGARGVHLVLPGGNAHVLGGG